jgi:hypothetical protein
MEYLLFYGGMFIGLLIGLMIREAYPKRKRE